MRNLPTGYIKEEQRFVLGHVNLPRTKRRTKKERQQEEEESEHEKLHGQRPEPYQRKMAASDKAGRRGVALGLFEISCHHHQPAFGRGEKAETVVPRWPNSKNPNLIRLWR